MGIFGQNPGAPPRKVESSKMLYIKRKRVKVPGFGTILNKSKAQIPIVIAVTNAEESGIPVAATTPAPVSTLITKIEAAINEINTSSLVVSCLNIDFLIFNSLFLLNLFQIFSVLLLIVHAFFVLSFPLLVQMYEGCGNIYWQR